jgi:hypothetical protein
MRWRKERDAVRGRSLLCWLGVIIETLVTRADITDESSSGCSVFTKFTRKLCSARLTDLTHISYPARVTFWQFLRHGPPSNVYGL